MSANDHPGRRLPPTPAGRVLITGMVLVLAAGALGWTWTGDWRLGATALVLALLHAAAASAFDSPQARLRRSSNHICPTCWTDLRSRGS